jgi:hypothetical protein
VFNRSAHDMVMISLLMYIFVNVFWMYMFVVLDKTI